MRPITPPLTGNSQGSEVINLQDGLLLLLNRQFLRSITANDLQAYLAGLRKEQIAQAYGKVTTKLVAIFQEQSQLPAQGEVDGPTAEALNKILKELGAFEQPSQFIVRGRVFGSERTPISGIFVRAFDHDGRSEDILLGGTTTNQDGYYEIRYSAQQFRRPGNERGGADLIVRVYDAQAQVITTSPTINNAKAEETIDIVVQPQQPPEPDPDQFIVKGTIRQFNDKPFVGAIVRAFDRDFRREQLLGEKTTDRTGYYEISYTRAQFSSAEKDSADLIVRVYGEATGQPLVASDIIFNAKSVEVVDLVVIREEDRTRSLFERLLLELRPLLREQAIGDLREDANENLAEGQYKDITFLSGETGFDKTTLARLVIAHKLAQQAIQPEFWFALLGGSIYQYNEAQTLDQQFAAILEALPSLDASAVNKSLSRSFNQNEIPASLKENVAGWVEAFLQFIAKQAVSDSPQSSFVKLSLVDAGIEGSEKQEKFARLHNQSKAITPELVRALQQDPSFSQPEIDTLQTSFRLADLTQGDFSVVRAIKNEFGVRQPEQIRVLAKRSEREWVNLATTKHAAGEINLPFEVSAIAGQARLPEAEVYGKMLDRQFREAFPTTAFTGGLERALRNGGAHGIQRAETLGRFLDRHETFELLNTPVDDFLKDNLHTEFQELATDNNFRLEVKAVQRVFKLSPSFEATDALLADDLHSAQKIYRMGESEFVRQYGDRPGFTPETAQLAWNRAADTHAAVLTIVADLKALETEALPLALQNNNANLSNFPNWNNLFQTGDLCECEHCRSVLSPAAYFADLLMFLKDRETHTGNGKVKDVLFRRRPDLGFLELNCDNALVPLPYVDVVCEVLESAIDSTGANDLELTGFITIPSDPTTAKAAVAAALQAAFSLPINNGKQKIDLGSGVSLSQVTASDPDRWVVHSDTVTYLLKRKAPAPHFFAIILRNTKAKAEELRSYPQYVNPKAYEKLRQAKYPMTLPFDLFAEEVRAGFQKTNLQRWDLMQTLRGNAVPNNPSDSEIAAEYFGISVSANPADPSEKNLILVANATAAWQQEIWGEMSNAGWLNPNPTTDAEIKNAVGNVKKFLQKTNLEYNELLILLDLKFINPTGNITIRHFDPSCDTDKKAVLVLDAPALDLIHRFLRLWRKLNSWKLWELDLVIRHPSIGNGALDEPFLINLFYFSQLKDRLGGKTTVEQVCALFGNLNTETHFIKLHEKRQDALYQNLFLNKRLIQPLDAAFEVTKVDVAGPTTEKISSHHPVLLAALGVREADLLLLKGLTNDLTLTNLSFLWRHAWLSKLLKFKVEDWKLALKLFQQDILQFANPQTAWELIEKIDQLKTAGFTADDLNWLLAGDRSAKAATKEADAARFLTALRKDLQAIKTEYDPTRYAFLTITPPTDVNSLTALLTSLLQKLNRSEAEVSSFLATLRGSVLLAASVQGLPPGFTFPAAIVGAPNHVPIQYDEPNKRLYSTTQMTDDQRQILLDDTSATLVTLGSSILSETEVQGLPVGFTFPATIIGAPNNILIQYDEPNKRFRFTGVMTATQQQILLSDASLAAITGISAYKNAIQELYQQSLKAISNYRAAIEDLYEQSLKAVTDYWSMEKVVALPGTFAFPATITGTPNAIPIRFEQVLRFAGVMTTAQKNILLNDPSLAAVTGIVSYQQAIEALSQKPGTATVAGLPTGFTFPVSITGVPNNIPIRYKQTLRFTGVMTNAQKNTLLNDPSLAAVTGIAPYQTAIAEFFDSPRMAAKFFEPVFTASLVKLPSEVDFKAQLPADLAAKITYDAEQELLRFNGIMSDAEKTAILALSGDLAYVAAVNSLKNQPQTITPPDDRIWLIESDLDITQPNNDTYAKRLATAASKALTYLLKTSAENVVVQQSSPQLGLTEAVSRYLLTQYAIVPNLPNPAKNLLTHLTGDFTIDATTVSALFWANRVATIWMKWKLTLSELKKVTVLTTGAQLLDFGTLPLDSAGAIAAIARFLRTSRLLRLRDSLPETQITLLEVLVKLNAGTYATAAAFATDVERLNEDWLAADVAALIASLNLTYPANYLLAETWERLRRAFYFLDSLNTSADRVKMFAAPAMTFAESTTLKELLRSKFGTETWLTLSAEIQDVLRERKRDALAAYLLAQPQPIDAPSGKWETTNDLYAYYLLDVEMCSCQLTSRLVQASGSVQLFVQRCLMGLEPDVIVKADGDDGDSAWRWWKWMRKYRVWEANRKVFLWPENWIEPELKKDRSSFFKDMENELLQNEINQDTVEKAFTNYLEKLDGVAQLEIAGFYQEDDGDNAIIHVFGRTYGAEPHLYYYRRYDYRQWTPWEKVDLDIQGDYLIPAVVNKRLFLFWPVFTEIPDEAGNSTVSTPQANQSNIPLQKTKKKLRLQMAVSDLRQGKWTPKRVSNELNSSFPSHEVEIIKQNYQFFAVDKTDVDGRFVIEYEGNSVDANGSSFDTNGLLAPLSGVINIAGCKGVPVPGEVPYGYFKHGVRPKLSSTGGNNRDTIFSKWIERFVRRDNDFTLENQFATAAFEGFRFTPVLMQTPGLFEMSPPWHLSYFDKLLLDGNLFERRIGTWSAFFYNDQKRTFFVLPSLLQERQDQLTNVGGSVRNYYPEIKKGFRQLEDYFEGQVQTWLNSITLPAPTSDQRKQMEQFLWQAFPEEPLPPYPGDQAKNLLKRFIMRSYRYYLGTVSLLFFQFRQFHFKNFYHPFVCDFAKLVYNPLKGIPALMSRETQLKNSGFSFEQVYQPQAAVVKLPPQYPTLPNCYPVEDVDFTPDGAYSPYNWELFFHAPLLIANSLSKNQRFEEARDWYHFIFNPIGVESPVPFLPGDSLMRKYWITKPFFETTDQTYIQERIDNILRMLAGDTTVPGYSPQAKKDLEDQVLDWRTNPFEPHRIANYRTVAYQKTVVMKYLDNLIAWGDNLFRQDSMESINEATQLYVLAAEILGPRPKKIPPQVKPPVESFNELETQFDKFSNALVQVENLIPVMPGNGQNGNSAAPLPMLYFCIPQNDKMLGYWDTVADRLYKIRHCMNIEGVVRQLALFEPPIDPGALVKAVAGGVDISSALADLNAPLPLYRFSVLLQKANEVCNDVKALGSALLSALEKKDAEAMGLLRQSQENRLLEAVKAVREQQIKEARENLEGIKKAKMTVETRRNYYRDIEKLITQEKLHLDKLGEAHTKSEIAQGIKLGASIISYLPAIDIGVSGFGGSPIAKFKIGGLELGQAASLASDVLSFLSQIASNDAAMASSNASFDRRWDDWKFQEHIADKELDQMDKQIAAAELRVAISEKELANHIIQIENAKATDQFMRSKYTSQELYQWQIGQISGVYFQSYRLAYDLAKRAERCFRFELGLQDSSYINFGYWDSLKKGLLSGEKLQYDLRRLEASYMEQNRREFELTKHISLTLLDPLALIKLRETGRCFINLPEEAFDLDYPGHYFRRIKSVSLTLPCVVGPYTTISCTLRLLKNSIRIDTKNGDNGYPRNTDDQGLPADDSRFIENNIPVKAIAASNAQNDSGVFELSFRDERYLPFEGAGAISQWSLELFNDNSADFGKALRQFDYSTITDAILHIKYTAREDAGAFKNGAIAHLRDYFSQDGATPSLRMFNLRQEFPTQWHQFLNPTKPADGNGFELEIIPNLFPIRDTSKTLKVNKIWLVARCNNAGNYTIVMTPPLPEPPPVGANTLTLTPVNQYGGLHFSQKDVEIEIDLAAAPVKWQLRMSRSGGNVPEEVEDVLLVLGYEWESNA